MIINPLESINPSFKVTYSGNPQLGDVKIKSSGLIKLEYFALKAKDDFDDLPEAVQEYIVGHSKPDIIQVTDFTNWYLRGRSVWKLMQATNLMEVINEAINSKSKPLI